MAGMSESKTKTQVSSSSEGKTLSKDRKGGFSVGPANLPDGVHRRKVQKIKNSLIRKAQLKKSYSKIRDRELINQGSTKLYENTDTEAEMPPAATLELHPDRQAMLDNGEPETNPHLPSQRIAKPYKERIHRARPAPFDKPAEVGRQRIREREAKQKAFEEAMQERDSKREERERFRKAMAKARTGGRDGAQRKLGRESKVLLERVQKMVKE